MGWKSTLHISRKDAEKAYLLVKLLKKKEKWLEEARNLSDEELGDAIDVLGDNYDALDDIPSPYGYYGHNFLIGERPNDY